MEKLRKQTQSFSNVVFSFRTAR